MEKRGFTLIELLAVIVILAIIALIATPIILGIIKDAKEQSTKRSAELYINAVEQAVARKNLNQEFNPSECKIEEGILKCDGELLEVEIEGEVPKDDTIIKFQKGKAINGSELIFREYIVSINKNGEMEVNPITKEETTYKKYNNGDVVYFDIKAGKGCTKELYETSWDETKKDYLNSNTGYNGYTNKDSSNNETTKLEKQNSCLKFYSFSDDGSDKLNLLLDHSTTDKLAWNSSGNITSGPAEVKQKLYEDTKVWNGTIKLLDYALNQSTQPSQANYTIEYSKVPEYEGATTPYKARLITAQEIAQITGANKEPLNWKEESSTGWYYFLDLSTSVSTGRGDVCKTNCKHGWLYDRTATDCTTYGCPNNSDKTIAGYWTSSACASTHAWYVGYKGQVSSARGAHESGYNGVRPVIEVEKSKLK